MKVKKWWKTQRRSRKASLYWVDSKIDKDTLMYRPREVMDENWETKLKKGKGEEHHLTFTKEPGTGTYLTYRVIPVKGVTAAVLRDEVHSVLKEFSSVHTLKAVLVDNTNTGCEGGLVTILENKTQRKLHTICCSLYQSCFQTPWWQNQKSNCFHWSTGKTLWNWPPWCAPGWIHSAQWSPRSHKVWRDDTGWSQ